MQTEVRVNYLNCHIHVPSNTFWQTEANSRHTYDVTIWLCRTTDNSNIFIRSREVRDNESRLYRENKPRPLAAMFFDESKWLEQSWQRITKGTFLQNYIEICPVVSDKKIFKVFYIDI